jgi:MFS transporter, NNP family, nitrate/nitrite transporter
MSILSLAVVSMVVFSLFVQMAEGASYAVVPFIIKKRWGRSPASSAREATPALSSRGFLFAQEGIHYPQALMILGVIVAAVSFSALLVRFSKQEETDTKREMESSLRIHEELHSIPAAVKHVAADTKIRRYT